MLHLSNGNVVLFYSPNAEFRSNILDRIRSGSSTEQIVSEVVTGCTSADVGRLGFGDLNLVASGILQSEIWGEGDDGLRETLAVIFLARINELAEFSVHFNPALRNVVEREINKTVQVNKNLLSFVAYKVSGLNPDGSDQQRSQYPTENHADLEEIASDSKTSDVTNDTSLKQNSAPVMPREALALAALIQHPEWKKKQIAEYVGCAVSTLWTWEKFKAAWNVKHSTIPRGSKTKDGNVEAVDPDSI